MELFIRPVEPEDSQNLLILLAQLTKESTTFMVMQDLSVVSAMSEANSIAYMQSTTNNIMLVVSDENDNLYGLASAVSGIDGDRAEIGVAVLAQYQGNGLAQALIEELLVWAQDYSSVVALELSVQLHNEAAIHIYEKYGFNWVEGTEKTIQNTAGEDVVTKDMSFTV